jgi:dolichol-phosphate mannosyltransferase
MSTSNEYRSPDFRLAFNLEGANNAQFLRGNMTQASIAVVIPAYKVAGQILNVLREIGNEVDHIILVDDACPEESGELASKEFKDKRLVVIHHAKNLGVGGAVVSGYREALNLGARIVVKLDGDGQMDPKSISDLVEPILEGRADYAKGNRFDSLTGLRTMPGVRILGNGGLSLMTKLSTGYWNITDPTNGFTAIHKEVLEALPLEMLSKRFFFESDVLFRLSLTKAVVWDVPMVAKYGKEKSNLKIGRTLLEFPIKHLLNFHKRLFYNYYLRDMSIASLELPLGLALGWFGLLFGVSRWSESLASGEAATAGTVMLSAVPLILGVQLVLGFLSQDMASVPKRVRHRVI